MACDKKKVLIVDDSALMRRMICDIITSDDAFEVKDMAADGKQGLQLLRQNTYDVVILDIVMPEVDGIRVLEEMQNMSAQPNVVVFSSEVGDGTKVTIQALELGAFDFIKKPRSVEDAKTEQFTKRFLSILRLAVQAGSSKKRRRLQMPALPAVSKFKGGTDGSKIVAIASSTGGPKALQSIVPLLPANLDAPVLVVQHMPAGFTDSLAKRLDEMSALHVQEAQSGMEVTRGNVYIAKGGYHMETVQKNSRVLLSLRDGPTREGVKPCANFMYESLSETEYGLIVCAVLTGMGCDATAGIRHLKQKKSVYTIAQDQKTCVVHGMPGAACAAGIVDQVKPIDKIAQAIINKVGVY